MKKLLSVLVLFGWMGFPSFAQHVDGTSGKTYYDTAKTKLKEVYAYEEVSTLSYTGDRSITQVKKVKHGPYFYYYESGKLKVSGNFANDKKHGTWKYFDEQGNITKTEEYKNGELFDPDDE
jgi:antitoxin component YwqK of YwqJK toxin-antitoxin module